MHVINKPRATGKTTQLLHLAIDEGYIFVTHSYREIIRLEDVCKEQCLKAPEFMTYDKFLTGEWTKRLGKKGLVIDNVDMFLQQLAGPVEVKAITVNSEEQK